MYDTQRAAMIYNESTRYTGLGDSYHYTSIDNADKILTYNGVDFRTTNINDFSDKTEGKAFGQFYISALERLLYERVIDFETFNILSSVKPMETHPFYAEDRKLGCMVMTVKEYDTHVLCFTTDGNSRYMENNYIRGDGHQGCVIKVRNGAFTECCGGLQKNSKRFVFKVMYGKEAVDNIYSYIKSLLACGDITEDNMNKFVKPLIEMYLHRVMYCVKLEKYRQEKEVRIITFTPKEDEKAECGKENSTVGKSYKHIELRKNSCLGVRVTGDFSNDNRGGVLNRLKERKYRLEHN